MALDSEPLVALKEDGLLTIMPAYASRAIPGAVDKAYVRETVRKMLSVAAKSLSGHNVQLCVVDAWRPFCVQAALYDHELSRLEKEGDDYPLETVRTYVSLPSCTPGTISPHLTGGAVDVIPLVDGVVPNCGCWFDEFGAAARYAHVENRWQTLLREAMLSAGFSAYDEEWWHFDFGNRFWAAANHRAEGYFAAWPTGHNFISQICGSPIGRVLLATDSHDLSLLKTAVEYAETVIDRDRSVGEQTLKFSDAVARYGFWIMPA